MLVLHTVRPYDGPLMIIILYPLMVIITNMRVISALFQDSAAWLSSLNDHVDIDIQRHQMLILPYALMLLDLCIDMMICTYDAGMPVSRALEPA